MAGIRSPRCFAFGPRLIPRRIVSACIRVLDGELYMQLRDGRLVPYVEWFEIRRRDPLEEMRWREVCRRMDAKRPGD